MKEIFKLPKIDYEYKDLEPFIDAKTMEIHHTKHHQNYINNLNICLNKNNIENNDLKSLLIKDVPALPEEIKTTIINNGGGHFNHSFFWKTLKLNDICKENYKINIFIKKFFGDMENFKNQFSAKAQSLFGSGWTWLIYDFQNKLQILNTLNQNTVLEIGHPILGLDIWEHAYYLSYQNRRKDYIEAFYNVISWSQIEKNLNQAIIDNLSSHNE
ncbi:MAG: superoxide dismutase [Candidatus Phytoplasma stylosanthis]|uniref:superoxide dismutase n=1 Tax=Candidatus Phytoplasma stylosanthis TaxID=2798314 RepID=UPI00293A74B5|nr:superoxide dismutase [Candidatus Phytoplasma stylosanthis]MDV3167754.1 superoxide dismutase [Candidatus Phytoplasma stylosanthis]MDV3170969.1 superoxide dismutase [Candidatus Phytoplasma stylosanthis]MDV3174141.1 superoxide dismutase [Candidatus Phytoplasma stylosanthis]MDV3202340.1 superoxide dismutase [Candidatus Phytoplasma stylosanthis]